MYIFTVLCSHLRSFSSDAPAPADSEAIGSGARCGREQSGAHVPGPRPRRPQLRAAHLQRTPRVRLVQSGQRALRVRTLCAH